MDRSFNFIASAPPNSDGGGDVPGHCTHTPSFGIYDLEHGPLPLFADTDFVPAKGQQDRIGTIAPGKQADLMVVKGNPATTISDIERVEIVFKDGVGYDSEKLIQSVQGLVGIR